MKHTIFIDILLLLGVVYLFSCSDNNTTNNASYNINHYIDTINDHIILTTVCDEYYRNNISVSTLEFIDINN